MEVQTRIMFITYSVIVFCTLLSLGESAGPLKNTCKNGYEKMKDSTMCLETSKDFISGGVTDKEKQEIVDLHNKYRREANATDLMALVWDDDIAAVAQKWAETCIFAHDKNRRVASLPGIHIGQNGAAGYSTLVGATAGWASEITNFEYGKGSKNGGVVGHYTQVVNNHAIRIGCGFAICKGGWGRYGYCNYGVGQYGTAHPYTEGKHCAACPDHCTDKLCDCGGLLCLNGGSLDKKTCTCNCPKKYGGKDCSIKLPCDGMVCYNGATFDEAACKCHCKSNEYNGKECEFREDMSSGRLICKFAAKKVTLHTKEQCKTYGDNGKDVSYACKSYSGDWGCGNCNWNVPTGYCPVMCGICQLCGGLVCLNGEELDEDTCTCKCPKNYRGKNCSEKIPCDGKTCLNKGILDTKECKCRCPDNYSGDLCQFFEDMSSGSMVCKFSNKKVEYHTPDKCKTYGDNGKDVSYACKSHSGEWGCGNCHWNVPTGYCPVMCGICPPCNGLVCLNGGKLNAKTCKCSCNKGFEGPDCSVKVKCNGKCPDGEILDTTTCTCDKIEAVTILRRVDGKVNFQQNWLAYEAGFGDCETGDCWLGLRKLYNLCRDNCKLQVKMTFEGKRYHANYNTFIIGDKADMYRLKIGGYSGDAGDDLAWNNGMKFSTMDSDNDIWIKGQCAKTFTGGWWYTRCHYAHPTGVWGSKVFGKGINWYTKTTWYDSLSSITLRVIPTSD